MLSAIKNCLQRLYPYGIFTLPAPLLSEGGRGEAAKVAYLTFDDGPIPEVTPQVLAILAKYNIKATFFMVGENIDKHSDIFAQVVQDGHSIGNHTYNHLKGWNCSNADYLANVQKWEEAVHRTPYTIHHTPLFRPPYGKATLSQRRTLHQLGYRIIYWDILTQDYNPTRTPEYMLAKIKRQVRPGSIINFHDSVKSNERMLTVLPQAIEWLMQQGYTFAAL